MKNNTHSRCRFAAIFSFSLLFAGFKLAAQPVYDGNGTSNEGANLMTISISSFTVPVNDNRLLVVCTANAANAVAPTVSYGSTPMTMAVNRSNTNGLRATMFYLVLGSGAAVTQTITATGTNLYRIGASSFHNVLQSDPTDGEVNFQTPAAVTSSTLAVSSTANDLVCDCISYFASGFTGFSVGSGQTQTFQTGLSGLAIGLAQSIEAGASPLVNMGWTLNGTTTSGGGVQLGMNLKSASCPAASGPIWYVDAAAASGGTGASWACAFQNLQDAIDAAGSGHEIWVKSGTYFPTKDPFGNASPTNPRDKTFYLKDGVAVYGGFAGTETLRSQRDWTSTPTILSGDIGTANDSTDNAFHVVLSVNDASTTVLDGFTVTKANASTGTSITVDGKTIYRYFGGGLYTNNSAIVVANCSIVGNTAGYGGGTYNEGGTTTYSDCTFTLNYAKQGSTIQNGGGMQNTNATVTLTNCTFSGNVAGYGGGMFNNITCNVTLTGCNFLNNYTGSGGGIYNNPGNSNTINLTLNRCKFSGNTAWFYGGGGMYNDSPGTVTGTAMNCLFSGNKAIAYAGVYGGALLYTNCTFSGNWNDGANANPTIQASSGSFKNCVFWNNRSGTVTGSLASSIGSSTAGFSYCLAQNATPDGTGNLDGITNAATANFPNFVTALDPVTAPSTLGDFHIQTGSPLANAGTNTGAPSTDLFGTPRPSGSSSDIGVHELQESCPATGTIWYVDILAASGGNGASWACAFQNLQDAIDAASSGHEIWVKTGTYLPTKDPFGSASPTDPRDKTFYLKNGVAVYGGFEGSETMRSERDWAANPTILSGDIGTAGDNSDNCHHVVLSVSDAGTTELDGFTVTKGNADGTGSFLVETKTIGRTQGGGMHNHTTSTTVANCVFDLSTGSNCGGMFNNSTTNLTVTNCVFSSNTSTLSGTAGGGVYNLASSVVTFTNCTFSGNSGNTAGAMLNSNAVNAVVTNCTFSGNSSDGSAGAMTNQGNSNAVVTNCLFSGNYGVNGAFFNNSSSPTLTNCTISGNSTLNLSAAGGITNNSATPTLKNCIIWNNRVSTTTGSAAANMVNISSTPVISNSLIQNWNPSGTDNLDGISNAANSNYPNFVTPLDPTTAPSTSGDFHLTACSPVLNLGTNTGAPTTDLFGNTRPFGTTVDLGAHELQSNSGIPTVANAGANQSVGVNFATMSANTPVVGSGEWSLVSGSGTITNSGSPGTTITNLGIGTNIFRWTISNAPCTSSTSDVEVTYTSSVNLTCPVNTTTAACQTQEAVDNAFSTWLATASASGGCSGVLTNDNTGAPSVCGGSTTVTFTYTSTCAPLTTTCQATFAVAAAASPTPVFANCTNNTVNLGCRPNNLPTCEGIAAGGFGGAVTASNSCGAVPVTCTAGTISINGCTRTQVFTFEATACGQTVTCTRTFTWTVVTPPSFNGTCGNGVINLGCNPTTLPSCDPNVTASNECGPVSVTCNVGAITSNGCNRSQTLTYVANAPGCGTFSTCIKIYNWTVATAPVITNNNTMVDLGYNPATLPSCSNITQTPFGGTISALNECGTVTTTCSAGTITANGCDRTQVFTITATACGLSGTSTRTFNWQQGTAPTGNATQTFCAGATIADLVAIGTGLKWYDAATNGNLLATNTTLTNGTIYYASQTVASCESPSRLAVTVTVNTTSAPTGSATQTFCAGAQVSNLVATGTALKWYDAATNGNLLATNTTLTNGTIYYASQTVASCESATRLAVTVTINTTSAPTGSATQTFCAGAQVSNLVATGTALKWYDAAANGTLLTNTALLTNGTVYYASQTVASCESATRLAVTVTINTTSAPTGSATQTFCTGATIADLVAAGTALKWYDAAANGTLLTNTALLTNGTVYYASQTVASCESATRLAVNVTANTAPVLTYTNASASAGGTTTNSPITATDNGIITGYIVQNPGTYSGTITVNASGVVSISNAAPVGSHTITIRATDNCGIFTDASFSLNVGNNNPIITAGAAATRQQGSAGTSATIATVNDSETAAGSLTVTATTVPTGITVTNIVNNAGTITATVTANCSATEGNNTVVLTVTDANSGTATANLTVNVTANTAPTLNYGNASVNAGGLTSNSPTAASDNGSISSYSVHNQGTYTGTISVNASGVVSISAAAPVGSHTITIRATDNCGAITDASFTLNVGNNNPTILAGATATRQQGSAGTSATIATVNDSETAAGSLTVTATTVPTGITVTNIVNNAGTITATVTANCSATAGNNTVVLTVTDANSGTATANFIVNVTANTAPTLTYGNASVAAGGTTTNTPTTATDNGSSSSYSVQNQGTYTGTITVNASGVVSISAAAPVGSHTITIRATDNCGATTDASFSLNVGNNNPTITAAAMVTRQQGSAGTSATIATVNDSETAAGSLTVTATTVPTGITVTNIVNNAGTITATVTANCSATEGNNTVVLTVTDVNSGTATANFIVNVTVNTAPTLTYGNASVAAGGTTTNTPTTATDNGSITGYSVQNKGTYTGTISVNALGVVSISAAAPVGSHTITIRATDNCGAITDASFSLNVGNNNPTITAAAMVTRQQGSGGTSSTIATVNDSETAAGSLTVTATTVPTGITVTNIVNNAGTITATVTANCSATAGNNTVVLTVTDANSGTATANFIVNVTANTAPTLNYGNASVNAGGSTSNSPTAASDNGSISSYSVQNKGTYTGTISVNASGVVSISAAAPVGSHTITIRATDNCGATTDASFSLNVGNNNPTILAGAAATRQQGSAGTSATIATVNDSETAAGSLTVTATTVPTGITVTNIVNNAGTITATVTANCSAVLNNNAVVLTVTDANSGTSTANFIVNVTVNTAPTLTYANASASAGGTTTNSPTTATDNGSITGYSVQNKGTYTGTISVNASGVVSISAAAPVGSHTITIRATDNCGAITDASFTLNVGNNNPTITAAAMVTRQQGSAGTSATIATVNDSETAAGSLTVTATTVPTGITVTNIVNNAGTITATVTANCSATEGNNTVVLTVTDVNSGTATANFIVNVTVNTAPTLTYGNASVAAGGTTTNTPTTATDNGSSSSYSVQNQGTYTGTITVNASGVVSISAAAPVGSHTITIRATDNCGATTDASFSLNVGNNNPTITAAAMVTRQQGSGGMSSTIATVNDSETAAGSLTVTATTVPTGITVTNIVNNAGTITATVTANCSATAGNNTVVLTVTDANSGTATANFIVNVTANTAPVLTYGNASVSAGGSTTHSPTAATDNGSITGYSVQNKGTYTGTISVNASGVVSISAAAPVGSHTITIRATDNCGATTDATFTLNVGNNNPTITAAAMVTRQQGSGGTSSTIATVNDSETAAGSLTVTATTVPTGITVTNIVNNAGTITATVTANCSATAGNNTVVLTVTDANSGTATANFIVNVTANTAPTLTYGNASVNAGGLTSNSPTAASDNGSISSYSVQNQGTYTGTISVNALGVVSISAAAPVGSHTITIRATDNCGATTDTSFSLTVISISLSDIVYVNASNTNPTQDGTTWANAYTSLSVGLSAAALQSNSVQVWVAQGTYKPGILRRDAFSIPSGVEVYGGFAGTETEINQRNWNTHKTILSGEIGTALPNDNVNHVVIFNQTVASTRLDGFTIEKGFADYVSSNQNTELTEPSVLSSGGGIVAINKSQGLITNCVVTNNKAITGGGVFLRDSSSVSVTKSVIWGNEATFGGGVYVLGSSTPVIVNSLIVSNKGLGGGMYINRSSPQLIHCTIASNQGTNGTVGGIFNSNASATVKNSILWGNSTPQSTLGITINYSLVQDGFSGTGNINQNPLFVNPSQSGLAPSVSLGDYHLQNCSPAINAGNNVDTPSEDLEGNARPYPAGTPIVDIGAYESQSAGGGGPALLSITEPISQGTVLKSAGKITADNQVTGATVEYRGSQSVTLLPGFSASNATFQAVIGGCETGAPSINQVNSQK